MPQPPALRNANETPSVSFASSWQGRQGSNLRPTVLETVALPTELHPYAPKRGACITAFPLRRNDIVTSLPGFVVACESKHDAAPAVPSRQEQAYPGCTSTAVP